MKRYLPCLAEFVRISKRAMKGQSSLTRSGTALQLVRANQCASQSSQLSIVQEVTG